MKRYMIYMPVGTQGRLIPCGRDGSLTLGEMETLVDGYIETLSSSLEPEWAREPAGRWRGRQAVRCQAQR